MDASRERQRGEGCMGKKRHNIDMGKKEQGQEIHKKMRKNKGKTYRISHIHTLHMKSPSNKHTQVHIF